MKLNKPLIIMLLIVAAVVIFLNSVFVVNETHQVVLTQSRKVVGLPISRPGLNFRWPFIQHAHYLPATILDWDGEPNQVQTLDKTSVWVDMFANWRITNPVAFYRSVRTVPAATNRIGEVIDPVVSDVIAAHKLIEVVRDSNRKMNAPQPMGTGGSGAAGAAAYQVKFGRAKLTKMMLAQARPKLNRMGIKLIDIRIRRINYSQKVRQSIYARMSAERQQMAAKIRSTGEGEARKIEGKRDRDLQVIRSEAFRKAEEIKGKADAEAALIYAKAYGVDPEFYSFTKSLSIYCKTLSGADLVISTDSKFLKYFKSDKPASDGGKK